MKCSPRTTSVDIPGLRGCVPWLRALTIPPGEQLRRSYRRMSGTSQGTYTIYDHAYPSKVPDTSTPARQAAVKLESVIRHHSLETGAFIATGGNVISTKT